MRFSLLVSSTILSSVLAVPFDIDLERRQLIATATETGGEIVTATAFGPPGASGALRGGSNLIGYNPSNPFPTDESSVVPSSDYELGENQQANPDLGLPIILEDVENPQPIAGPYNAPTDPGPSDPLLEQQNPSRHSA